MSFHEPDPLAYPPMPFNGDYSTARNQRHALAITAQKYLEPFEASIFSQVWSNPEAFEPNGLMFDELAPVLGKGNAATDEEVFDAGVNLGAWVRENAKNPRALVIGYLHASTQSEALKVGLVGPGLVDASTAKGTRTGTLNQIHAIMADVVVDALPISATTEKLFDVLADAVARAEKKEPYNRDSYVWIIAKLSVLYNKYRQISDMQKLADIKYGAVPEVRDISEATAQIDELTRDAMTHRKYGTKPAYTKASIGGSWLFYDGDGIRRKFNNNSQNTKIPPIAALVFHSPKEKLSDLTIGVEPLEFGGGGGFTVISGAIQGAETDAGIIIQLDGRMTVDYEGLVPLEVALKGRPTAVAHLKAEIAANFHDLSMPQNGEGVPKPLNFSQLQPKQKGTFDPIRDLLIPRIRYMRNNQGAAEGDDVVREVREHDVVWHIRRLPDGWHASPEAVAQAKGLGLELESNETFVRAHHRGSGERVLGYHALRK